MRRNILSPSSPRLGTVSGYDADLLAYFYPDSWPIFSTALTAANLSRSPAANARLSRSWSARSPKPSGSVIAVPAQTGGQGKSWLSWSPALTEAGRMNAAWTAMTSHRVLGRVQPDRLSATAVTALT